MSTDAFAEIDSFETLYKVVKKDCIDAATFDLRTQADLLCMMEENLFSLESTIAQIKSCLKEPMPETFEERKKLAVERLRS